MAEISRGDNITTKIESSQVEIEIGEASSTFWKIEIKNWEASSTFWKIEIEIGEASSTFWKIEIEIGEASPIDLAHIWFRLARFVAVVCGRLLRFCRDRIFSKNNGLPQSKAENVDHCV